MRRRTALRAVIDSVGIFVPCLIGGAAIVAAVIVALGMPAQGRADDTPSAPTLQPRPGVLVVALDLRDPVRQAGVVRGDEVILARGLEIDIARDLARRLHVPRVRFTFLPTASRVRPTGAREWHLALASLSPVRASTAHASPSHPYLGGDQAVVLRRGLPPLRRLGDLLEQTTCAVRGSAGAGALAGVIQGGGRSALALSQDRLMELVQTGVCDAALVDADAVGRLVAGRGGVLGPVAARVPFGEGSVVAVARAGPFTVLEVDRALRRMRADGTMHRIMRTWLGIDPSRLRLLGG